MQLPGIAPQAQALLQQAAQQGVRVALVGGAVRDLLLHRVHNDPWRGVPDLDLVVEGSALAWVGQLGELAAAQAPAGSLAVAAARPHGAYGTVEVELAIDGQPLLLDVATARQESYPQQGENPHVHFGSLDDDLRRRDFSINAMALVIGAGDPWPLLDPHGGQRDLEQRQLRFLHNSSVADDPTRLVRGARYAARLGFSLAPAALEQARSTLERWPWAWRRGDAPDQAPAALGTRLRMELELLLEREPWPAALAALQRWGGLALLDAALHNDRAWLRRLRWAERLQLPMLPALLAAAADPLALAERLQLPHRQHKLLAQWLGLRQRWRGLAGSQHGWSAAQWCQWLETPGFSPEAVALELACAGPEGLPRRPLLRWWLRWRQLKAPLSAAELRAAEGLRPGPALGERLRQLRAQRLAGERF